MNDHEDFAERGLDAMRLAKYSELLGGAISSYKAAMSQGVFVAPSEDEESIRVQMERILGYCVRHRTRQALWVEGLGTSGLLHELTRVIELIPFGYSQDDAEKWAVIHCIIRELLSESDVTKFDEEMVGFSSGALHLWRELYETYAEKFPPSCLPAKFEESMAKLKRWNDHLECKEEYADIYHREFDPYYDEKWNTYLCQNPDYQEARIANSEAHEEWLNGLTSDQREEASEESLGSDPLSSDAEYDMSSDDSNLD